MSRCQSYLSIPTKHVSNECGKSRYHSPEGAMVAGGFPAFFSAWFWFKYYDTQHKGLCHNLLERSIQPWGIIYSVDNCHIGACLDESGRSPSSAENIWAWIAKKVKLHFTRSHAGTRNRTLKKSDAPSTFSTSFYGETSRVLDDIPETKLFP
jgi:hypothetical protein